MKTSAVEDIKKLRDEEDQICFYRNEENKNNDYEWVNLLMK